MRLHRLLAATSLLVLAPCMAVAQQAAPAVSATTAAPAVPATAAAPATPATASTATQPVALAPPAAQQVTPVAGDGSQAWYTFNGQLDAQKYATADQINPDNVGKLQKAWEVHTGDVSDGKGDTPASDWSATPLFVNDTIYVSTPFYRVLALEPDTGKIKWTFDSKEPLKDPTQGELKTRGVSYWAAANPVAGQPCQKIVYLGSPQGHLFAIDADSGKACGNFGKDGMLDVNQWNTVNNKWPLSILQPPTIYKNEVIIGWSGQDWTQAVQPPGSVFAVDSRTGKLNWKFDAIPPDLDPKTGTSNVWASMSIDTKNNLLFLPISSPSPDYYGGDRLAPMPLSTSVTALNPDSGQVVWSRQLVHHDIWDYDTNSAPVLVDLNKDGKTIPALIQSTKQGLLFVLNRLTGEPVYPIDEKPFPASDVKGEQASATQPIPTGLQPTTPDRFPGISGLADTLSGGECSRTAAGMRYEGRYTPPALNGTLAFPATAGGVEWGGGAVDPTTNSYVVNSSDVVQIYKLLTRDDYNKAIAQPDAKSQGYSAMEGAPYGVQIKTFLNWLGMPCWNGPYGTLSSYDLNTGKLNWQFPFGQIQKWGFYMPVSWGSVTIGAPVVTKSGVIFIGASMDSRVRAIDLKSGKVLWQGLVDSPAVAMPAVYTYKGKEYVLFAVGGNSILEPKVADQLVAFALPS